MKFEDSDLTTLVYTKIEFSFGNFYFLEKFIVSEINEGVHFDWPKAKKVLDYTFAHYGNNFRVGYIANRVNSYSIDLQNFLNMRKINYNHFIAEAIVIYNETGLKVASLEKLFAKYSIKRCFSLEEAVLWILNLNEFKTKTFKK